MLRTERKPGVSQVESTQSTQEIIVTWGIVLVESRWREAVRLEIVIFNQAL